MIKYKESGFKAISKNYFSIVGDCAGVFSVDDDGVLVDDESIEVTPNEELEYFFTRDDGWHFVHHKEYESGFWVNPRHVDIVTK